MKISSYYRNKGKETTLKIDYKDLSKYEKVFISKVFTRTKVDKEVLEFSNVFYGGTGFFYDKAPELPYEIEHSFPDYNLYSSFIKIKQEDTKSIKTYKYYTDYSIGFTTRGCFRKCGFCVNKRYSKCLKHSPLKEFLNLELNKICLLDDNILANSNYRSIFESLIETNKRFVFKQGLDIRLLNEESAKLLNRSKYDGDILFSFDNIKDYKLIEQKLYMFRNISTKPVKIYVLCCYDENDKYDEEFWKNDIISVFERVLLLRKYKVIPFLMRYEKYRNSHYYGIYVNIANWLNNPRFYKAISLREYCNIVQKKVRIYPCSAIRYLTEFEKKYPEIAKKYFDFSFL